MYSSLTVLQKSAVLFALVISWTSSSIKIWCDCRLTFPSEDLYESTSSWKGFNGFNNFNEINDSNKWAWRNWSPNGFAYQDGAWKWTPMSERTLKFPDSDEVIVTTAQKKTGDSSPPRWPRTSLYKNFHTGEKTNQLHYAQKYAHSPSHVARVPSSYQALPQKLQNYYKPYYGNGNSNGNGNTPIQSGSEFEPVAYTPPLPLEWDSEFPEGPESKLPEVYGQHVYPKHIYYGRPRAETEGSKKKFSLEIHPAYLVAPLAGLATFGLVSKIVKTPVLLELGLVEKEKEKEPESEDAKLHHHEHQHEHHHHKFPNGGPGIIGLWPIPYPPYPSASASAVSSASSSSSSSSSSGSSPQESMNSFVSATQIPIILGPLSPTTPSTPALSAADPRPWWSSFAAMIPRLRLGDSERDR